MYLHIKSQMFTMCSCPSRHSSSKYVFFFSACPHLRTHMQCGRVPCGFLWFRQSSRPHTDTSNLPDRTVLPPAAGLFLYWLLALRDLKNNTKALLSCYILLDFTLKQETQLLKYRKKLCFWRNRSALLMMGSMESIWTIKSYIMHSLALAKVWINNV